VVHAVAKAVVVVDKAVAHDRACQAGGAWHNDGVGFEI